MKNCQISLKKLLKVSYFALLQKQSCLWCKYIYNSQSMFWKRMASLKDNLSTQCILHFHIHAKRNGTKVHFQCTCRKIRRTSFHPFFGTSLSCHHKCDDWSCTSRVVFLPLTCRCELIRATGGTRVQIPGYISAIINLLVSSIRPTPKVVSHNPLSQPIYGKHYR